eukprot:3157591-Rhodomonas_salina.3
MSRYPEFERWRHSRVDVRLCLVYLQPLDRKAPGLGPVQVERGQRDPLQDGSPGQGAQGGASASTGHRHQRHRSLDASTNRAQMHRMLVPIELSVVGHERSEMRRLAELEHHTRSQHRTPHRTRVGR